MITRFTLKQDAEAFCRELEDRCGVGVFHHMYKGHRHYCVQHNDMSAEEYEARTKKHDAECEMKLKTTYRGYEIEYEPARGFPIIKDGTEVYLAISALAAIEWIKIKLAREKNETNPNQ